MKKALVKLKLTDLKNAAARVGVDWQGREEEIADRLVRALGFDEERVARLIHLDAPGRPRTGRLVCTKGRRAPLGGVW
jgi:hypothetical protein